MSEMVGFAGSRSSISVSASGNRSMQDVSATMGVAQIHKGHSLVQMAILKLLGVGDVRVSRFRAI